MTPLPKKKHSRARSNQRKNAATNRPKKIGYLMKCPSCGKLKEPHKACPSCGFYK